MSEHPTADTHVRLALPAEAGPIGAVQVAAWRAAYRDLLPAEVLDQLDAEQFAQRWRKALLSPGQARNRVLVALDHERVVGFAATTAADDPDADPAADALVAEFRVHPDETRAGHGSRLLHAVADTLTADGFDRATIWLNATDDPLREFLTAAGWAPDGAHRELDLYGDGSVRVKQVRLHTDPRPTDT